MDSKLRLEEFELKEDGSFKIIHGQEALSIYESNEKFKQLTKGNRATRFPIFHVARIPAADYLQWQKHGIWEDDKEAARMLNRNSHNKVTTKIL